MIDTETSMIPAHVHLVMDNHRIIHDTIGHDSPKMYEELASKLIYLFKN